MSAAGEGKRERRINLSQYVFGLTALVAAFRADLAASLTVLLALAALMLLCSVYLAGWRRRVMNVAGAVLSAVALGSIIYTMANAQVSYTPVRAEAAARVPASGVGDGASASVQTSTREVGRRETKSTDREQNRVAVRQRGTGTRVVAESTTIADGRTKQAPANETEVVVEDRGRTVRSLVAQMLPPYVQDGRIHVEAVLRNDGSVPEVILRANVLIAKNEELQGQLYGPAMINETTIVSPGEARLLKHSFPIGLQDLREHLRDVASGAKLPVALSFRTYDPDGRTIDSQTIIGHIGVDGDAVVNGDGRYARADLLHDTIFEAAQKRWLASRGLTSR